MEVQECAGFLNNSEGSETYTNCDPVELSCLDMLPLAD